MKMNMFSRKERSQTESTPDKQSKPADAILKTYWVSLLSLMLCVTMFFGTTVAWFSDDVSAPYNQIDVGSLSVMLDFKKPADTDYTTLAKTGDTNTSNVQIFDENVPWAPGYTAVREIRVTNRGTLNLRYMFTFQEGIADDDRTWNGDFAKCFEVYVKDGSFDNEILPNNYNHLVNDTDQNGKHLWTPVKNLDGHVANLQEIVTQKLTVHAETIKHKENSSPSDTEHSFLVALHMKEDSEIGVSGKKFPLGAYLIAYQESTDEDDLGNTNPVIFVQNANELEAAVKGTSNYTIVLSENITMNGDLTIGKPLQLDLNGKKLKFEAKSNENGSLIVGAGGKLVIRDRTVVGANSTGGEIIPAGHIDVIGGGTLIVNGGMLHKVRVDGSTMIMNGGVVDGSNSGESDSSEPGITLMQSAKLELNYGTIKVKDGKCSVYADSGNCTVTVADTFHFFVGNVAKAEYGKDTNGNLTVNGETK